MRTLVHHVKVFCLDLIELLSILCNACLIFLFIKCSFSICDAFSDGPNLAYLFVEFGSDEGLKSTFA